MGMLVVVFSLLGVIPATSTGAGETVSPKLSALAGPVANNTKDGKALHQYHGLLPLAVVRVAKKGSDWFGSHGCVRLTEDDAKTLCNWTPNSGTKVTVVPLKK